MSDEQELKAAEDKIALLKRLASYSGPDRVVHVSEAIEEAKRARGGQFGAKSTLPTLDEILGGFRASDLAIISGPSGMGKTTLAKTFTHALTEQGVPCLWFSYEMPVIELTEEFPSAPSFWLPRQHVESKLLWVEQRIVEGIAKYGTRAVFIDHLHFLLDLRQLAAIRQSSVYVGLLVRDLKQLALKWDIMLFLIAHLKKVDLEGKDPAMDDIRDSSLIAAEANTVLMVWRKPKPRSNKEKRDGQPQEWTNEARISVVKNRRTGILRQVDVVYHYGDKKFYEITMNHEQFQQNRADIF